MSLFHFTNNDTKATQIGKHSGQDLNPVLLYSKVQANVLQDALMQIVVLMPHGQSLYLKITPNPGMQEAVCVHAQLLSHVQLSVILWTAAHQVPLSMGVFKKEYWSGLPFSSYRGSSQPRDQTWVSLCLLYCRQILYPLSQWENPRSRIVKHKSHRFSI